MIEAGEALNGGIHHEFEGVGCCESRIMVFVVRYPGLEQLAEADLLLEVFQITQGSVPGNGCVVKFGR